MERFADAEIPQGLVIETQKRKKDSLRLVRGKFSHLDFLLPNLPNDARHFCDVFGGSAAVLINREPRPGGDIQRS